MFERTLHKLKWIGQKGLDILFKPAETALEKWMVSILLALLFVVGIPALGLFLELVQQPF